MKRSVVPSAGIFVCVVLIFGGGCTPASNRSGFPGMTMPNPEGCFVHVWDAPKLAGTSDFINGPRDYPTLRDLPGGRLWGNRIRSAATGPVATVTLWTDENFQGGSFTLRPDTDYPGFPEASWDRPSR